MPAAQDKDVQDEVLVRRNLEERTHETPVTTTAKEKDMHTDKGITLLSVVVARRHCGDNNRTNPY